MIALLEVASVATYQSCWTVEAIDEAHCLGVGSVIEMNVSDGS